MSDFNWGYKQAKKMMADGGKVQVKGYARGGPVKKAAGGAIKIKPQNVGKLHATLGVAPDKKIPMAKIDKAVKSANPTLRKRAQFAKNAASFKKG